MSIFSGWFGPSRSKGANKVSFKQKSKLSSKEIEDLLWSISSLDKKQRDLVKSELLKQLDGGGITKYEYENVILDLNRRRVELGLSSIDIKNLKKVIYQ